MHKVLKDYLSTSQGDLLRVVERVKDMILNQYSRYQKDIASKYQNTRFNHRMPFLPQGIHQIITPPAIEHIRKQDLLRQLDSSQRKPCTGTFKRIYGLPCSHILQNLKEAGSPLTLSHFEDDHWRYQRQSRPLIPIVLPARPNQYVLEPRTVQGRGRPRRNESSTRRDPSAFERRVAPSQPPLQVQTIAEILAQTGAARVLVQRAQLPITLPTTFRVPPPLLNSLADPLPAPLDDPLPSLLPAISPLASPAASPADPPTYPPPRLAVNSIRDPWSLDAYLRENGLADAPPDIRQAHIMAQETSGIFAHYTFDSALEFLRRSGVLDGNVEMEAFYGPANSRNYDRRQPKRKAAQAAPEAWAALSPQKRRRH